MRPCLHPTCPVLVERGRCATHQVQARGNRHQQGYDSAWEALREQYLEETYPWFCALSSPRCTAKGRQMDKAEIQVDHIVPFVGKDDPRRLDKANLQVLCVACHRVKSNAARRWTTGGLDNVCAR